MKLSLRQTFGARSGELPLPLTITIYLSREERYIKDEIKKLQTADGSRFLNCSESAVAKVLLLEGLTRERSVLAGHSSHKD